MIKNYKDISNSRLRRDALKIVEAGLKSISPERFMSRVHLEGDILRIGRRRFILSNFKRVFVIGYGKASGLMARELEKILKEWIYKGVVISRRKVYCSRIEVLVGDHPLPGRKTLAASQRLLRLLKEVDRDDLVINLVSGGGSSLFELPERLKMRDINRVNKILLESGADIEDVNRVRIALSSVKGGKLLRSVKGNIVSLILSDVPSNEISFISSGPTAVSRFNRRDLIGIVKRYDLEERLGKDVIDALRKYRMEKVRCNAVNILIADNCYALEAMKREAERLGYRTKTVKNVRGEARDIGVRLLKKGFKGALIAGGESTVIVRGKGKGGRNQECALGALRAIKEEVFVSIGSDGIDNSRFAGAIVDRSTLRKASKLGLDIERFLERNDSYNFFRKVGDYILTGDTGSNVADLFLVLRG